MRAVQGMYGPAREGETLVELNLETLRQAGLEAAGVLDARTAAPLLRRDIGVFGGVIVALFPYYAGSAPGNLSLYARGQDYHAVLRRRLERAAQLLGLEAQPYADVSPFDEVRLGQAAGLGGVGQNGLLMNRAFGSFFFIGELVTAQELAPLHGGLEPACTGCGRCLRECPTGALRHGGLQLSFCLSHITQARRITPHQQALLQRSALIWGCDACQLCCPANLGLEPTALPEFSQGLLCSLGEDELRGLSDRAFRRAYGGRAFCFRGIRPLARNLELCGKEAAGDASLPKEL